MIHEDGIEVYLKPHGPENEDTKFAEFPLRDSETPEGEDEKRNKRCLVLAREGNFNVVVRCLPHFDMYSATAVSVSIGEGTHSGRAERKFITQRSLAFEQRVWTGNSFGHNGENIFKRRLRMVDASKAINGDFDGASRRSTLRNTPGSVTVRVRRLNPTWVDETEATTNSNRLYGPGDPSKDREFVVGKTKDLRGANGLAYTFEFQYRSEDCIRKAHEVESLVDDASISELPIDNIALIKDVKFRHIREQDKADRQRMSDAFKKRQAKIADAPPKTANTTKGSGELARKSGVKRQKPKPEFCDCPDPSHNHPKPKVAPTKTAKPRLGLPRVPKPQGLDEQESQGVPLLGPSKEEDGLLDTPTPPTCSKCKKLKVANSKRPAFLRKWYAKDEDDQDDEEIFQEPKPEIEDKQSEHEDDPGNAVLAAFDVEPHNRRFYVGGLRGFGDNTIEPAGSLGPGNGGNQQQDSTHAIVATINTEGPGTSLDNENSPDVTEHPLSSPATPIIDPSDQNKVPGAREAVYGETATASPQPVDSAVVDVSAAEQRAEKRAASDVVEQQPLKKPRIDIDLTIDDDDDLIVIKEEPKAQAEVKQPTKNSNEEDELDIQAELDEVLRQEREIQLERKKADLQRRLRAMQKQKPVDSVVKSEEVIKIED